MRFVYILLVLCASEAYPLPDVEPSPSPKEGHVLPCLRELDDIFVVRWGTTDFLVPLCASTAHSLPDVEPSPSPVSIEGNKNPDVYYTCLLMNSGCVSEAYLLPYLMSKTWDLLTLRQFPLREAGTVEPSPSPAYID